MHRLRGRRLLLLRSNGATDRCERVGAQGVDLVRGELEQGETGCVCVCVCVCVCLEISDFYVRVRERARKARATLSSA